VRKRQTVRALTDQYGVSSRRACGPVQVHRSTFFYISHGKDDRALRLRLRELAATRPRFGYLRLHILLRREGWLVNKKRIYRLYGEEGLSVRTKYRRKRASHCRVTPDLPTAPNQRWSMDFVADTLDDGRRFRALTVVDLFTRECLAIEADFSLPGRKVAAVLDRLALTRTLPKIITVDNGTEFISKEMDSWAYRRGVQLDFIRPGRPVENAHIESFNGRLRDECLNAELFLTLEDALQKLAEWKSDYNKSRTHSSLGGLSPLEFAAEWSSTNPQTVEFLNQKMVQSTG
jgi:putative transposase